MGPFRDLLHCRADLAGQGQELTLSNIKLAIGLILAAVVVFFTLQNAEIVELRLLFWKLSMPRALMIFSVLVVGIALGWILSELKRQRR